MSGDTIRDWTDALPQKFKKASHGINKQTGLSNLFRAIVLGPSMSGKTNLIFDLLKKTPSTYTHLHMICRNPDQPIFDYLKERLAGHITFYDPMEPPPTVDQIKENGLQMVIIDDFSNDKNLQKNVFSHYFTRGRHKGLSTIFLSHSYFATDKMIRLNSEYVMILRANSKRDLKMVLHDFPIRGVDESGLFRAYQECTKDKGQFLLINGVEQKLYKNWKGNLDWIQDEKKSSIS
jgi:hypothetical protein